MVNTGAGQRNTRADYLCRAVFVAVMAGGPTWIPMIARML